MNAISSFPLSLARADEFKPTKGDLRAKKRAEKALQKGNLRKVVNNLDPIARRSCEGAAWAREICLPYPDASRVRADYYMRSDREEVARVAEIRRSNREWCREHSLPRAQEPQCFADWGTWSDLFS